MGTAVDGKFVLDHVIVFVDELAAAERAYERLGLQITSHADHPGFGTRNAATAFQLGFVELLTEADPAELGSSRYGKLFLERHAARGNSPTVFVFKTPVFEDVIASCRARGGLCEDRKIGYSRGPDGVSQQWEAALMPGTEPIYLDPRLPVLGRARTGPAKTPGNHPMGASHIQGVVLAVKDLDATITLFAQQLGLEPSEVEEFRSARRARVTLNASGQQVIIAEPQHKDGPLTRHLARFGEGIFGVLLQVEDAERALALWKNNDVEITSTEWLGGLPMADSGRAANTRFVLCER